MNFIVLLVPIAFLVISAAQPSAASTPNWEVDTRQPASLDEANRMVTELLKATTVQTKEYFCKKNDLTCRVHYTLADQDGNVIAPFYVRFVAADRSQAAQGYFFPVAGQPGMYVRFEDFTFDGTVNVSVIPPELMKIEKSKTGRVAAIHGSVIPKLGTSLYTEAEVTVSGKGVVLEGIQRDKNDPTFQKHIRDVYLRTKLTK